jgi:hypothetical protein
MHFSCAIHAMNGHVLFGHTHEPPALQCVCSTNTVEFHCQEAHNPNSLPTNALQVTGNALSPRKIGKARLLNGTTCLKWNPLGGPSLRRAAMRCPRCRNMDLIQQRPTYLADGESHRAISSSSVQVLSRLRRQPGMACMMSC